MTHLEDELRITLSGHTATPSRDLLGAATRRHRRRRALQGGAASAGVLGLAGVLAFGLAGGPAGAPAPTPVVQLSVAALGEKMALAAESGDSANRIEHSTVAITQDGKTGTLQLWQFDGDAQHWRAKGRKGPDSPLVDVAQEFNGNRQTTIDINHDMKVWRRSFATLSPDDLARPGDCNDAPGLASDGNRCSYTAEAIREATRGEDPAFEKVGEESIDGRATIKLRDTERTEQTRYLYVDADSYEIVRIDTAYTGAQKGYRVVEDFEFLAPTEANQELLEAKAPDGYKRLPDQTFSDEPPAPKGEPGPGRG